MNPLTFAYYCSGHGYGHATRVSAVATYLRTVNPAPTVYIVSSAPKHVFQLALSSGARYRYAEIDPVIVQPLAYQVDRRKSVDVLKEFLSKKDQKIEEEVAWLKVNAVDCVLSDAAFLACKAANVAHVPSVLITNFTFDSVYSYLSIRFPEESTLNPSLSPDYAHNPNPDPKLLPLNDDPIPPEELEPLVKELLDGYRCAELLLRLPGNIPLPSFDVTPALPAHLWADPQQNTFVPDVLASLSRDIVSAKIHPSIPFSELAPKPLPRRIVQAPLIVRHPSPDIYTPAGRKRVLDSIGVPAHLQSTRTKILVVSFGGQVFRRPKSRNSSRSQSPSGSQRGCLGIVRTSSAESTSSTGSASSERCGHKEGYIKVLPPIATESHLWIPGAPPANKLNTPTSTSASIFESQIPQGVDGNILVRAPTQPDLEDQLDSSDSENEQNYLPDDSWIAIVCGSSASPKSTDGRTTRTSDEDDDALPANFFIAPRDIYMPDLTALGDVLLGKLGYGTTAECVDACIPCVFVPRPLFVEEHGLRRLLHDEGAGVELARERYEDGEWAGAVREAWMKGREMKARKRAVGDDGERRREGEAMARMMVEWVRDWQRAGDSEVCAEGKHSMNQLPTRSA